MESLKKLQKKYGKKKLNQFFKDIDKFLTVPQKKLNKKYIRLTRFGMKAGDSPIGQRAEDRESQGAAAETPAFTVLPGELPPDSPDALPRAGGTIGSPPQPRTLSLASPPPRTRYRSRSRDRIAAVAPPPASLGTIEKEFVKYMYVEFKQNACSAIILGEMVNFGILCRYVSDILQVIGGTKELADRLPGPFLNRKDVDDDDDEQGASFGAKTKMYSHLTRDNLEYLSENAVTPKDAANLKDYYNYEDTKGTAKTKGWHNTISQNLLEDRRVSREKCRCALCGCFMFYADAEKDNRYLCHSATVQLEHQIAGSTALRLYVDLYKYGRDNGNNWAEAKSENLKDIEAVFFENIGGSKAKRENRFVYCCSLCNQIKSDMYPFETGDNNLLEISDTNLGYFEDALGLTFRRIMGSGETKAGFQQTWKDASLTNANVCAFVWVLQSIFTFLSRDNIEELPDSIPENLTLEKVGEMVETAREIFRGKLSPNPQAEVWDEIKQRKETRALSYFGRPVYSAEETGETGGTKDELPFSSLAAKYRSIIEDIKKDFGIYYKEWRNAIPGSSN